MFELLHQNGNDLTDHDLAHLADWANDNKNIVPNLHWKKAYALIREGADLLLRRRSMSRVGISETIPAQTSVQGQTPDYADLRLALNDYNTIFYGPHECRSCGVLIIKAAIESGGRTYDAHDMKSARPHKCKATLMPSKEVADMVASIG